MIILYNILLTGLMAIITPFFLIATPFLRKRRGTVWARMGFSDMPDARQRIGGRPPIWVHALSVGEVTSAYPLVKKLKALFPDHPIWISATTKTGFETASRMFGEMGDHIFYFGYDCLFTVKRIAARVNPCMVIVVESDIWPNFLYVMKKRQIPVFLANARLSDRTLAGYRRLGFFMTPTLRRFSAICAQTETDAERFQSLGISPDRIVTTGNIKFDQVFPPVTDAEKATLRSAFRLPENTQIIVAGSTHKGEEAILAEAFAALKQRFPSLIFIDAPRDPARAKQVKSIFSRTGISAATMGQMKPSSARPPDVIVIDTIGLLQSLYALSDIAFVGGSLLDYRGHNPLEPAAHARPVLFGPYMGDFKEISEKLIAADGAKEVTSASDIIETAGLLLENRSVGRTMGKHARSVLDANQGAVKKTTDIIQQTFNHHPASQYGIPVQTSLTPQLLRPLSLLYGTGARLRRWLYHGPLLTPEQLPCPVISVGNITAGGTGKTPMTIYIARRLKAIGYSPAIISRGYRGSASREGGIVSDGKTIFMDTDQAGDEPLMMAQALPDVPVVVGKHKYRAAQTAIEEFSANVIILDDGFQHFQLARDLNILLLDSAAPTGNNRLLPAGPLREPLACLAYADVFVFTRTPASALTVPETITGMIGEKPAFNTRHQSFFAVVMPGGNNAVRLFRDRINPDRFTDKQAFVFSGLAKNEAFLNGIKTLIPGITIVGHRFYKDHHRYSANDLQTLSEQAMAAQANLLITSEKDFVKIPPNTDIPLDLLILGVEISFTDPAQVKAFDALLQKAAQSNP